MPFLNQLASNSFSRFFLKMPKVSIKIEGNEDLVRELARTPKQVARVEERILKQEGRALAYEYGFWTSPVRDKNPKKLQKRIINEIRRAFLDPTHPRSIGRTHALIKEVSPAKAAQYVRMVKSGETAGVNAFVARTLQIKRGVTRAFYESARDQFSSLKTKGKPLAIVTQKRQLSLIRQQLKLIGTAKAGWFQAQKEIGGRSRGAIQFPSYVRKAGGKKAGKLGGAKFRATRTKRTLEIYNEVDYAERATDELRFRKASQEVSARVRKNILIGITQLEKRRKSRRGRR